MNVKWSEFFRRRFQLQIFPASSKNYYKRCDPGIKNEGNSNSTTEPVFNKINIQIHAKNETGYTF